jgi:TP901 family phage tail tape measure protein
MTTRSVSVRLDLETAQAIAKSREFGTAMTTAMDQAEGASRRTGAALDDIGDKAGRLALGGAAALGSIAAAAVGWESAWAGVTKTVDGTVEEMQALEDGLRGLATTLPATHDEIAGVAEAAGQLGVAREDVVDFTETMVALGETTNLAAEDAATSIAQISNVMGTAGEDVDNFGAALVALGNDGASTEKQILDMAQRIAGAAAQVGLSEADILAVANAAASMGIEAEAGGSAISRVFSDMAKATAQGGDQLERYAEVAGVSASQFAASFGQDPAQAFATFTAGLDQIKESGGDVFTVLDDLKLSDIRVSQALLGMAASGDLLSDSLEVGSRAWEENTALAREAAKRYETTASETQVAWNKIKDAGIEAGDSLLPVVGAVADKVGAVADAFGELPDPVQGAFTQLLAIGTLTAGAGWLGIKTVSAISSTTSSLASLRAEGGKTAGVMTGLSKAAGGLLILAAVATAAEALRAATAESLPGMSELTNDLIDLSEGKIDTLGKEFDSLGDSIIRMADPGKIKAASDGILGVISLGQLDGKEIDGARQEIEALDVALANLATAAGSDTATQAFEDLAEAQNLTAREQKLLMSILPGYTEALAANKTQAKLDADAHVEIDTGARRAASGITYTAEQIEAARDAYQDQRDAANDVAQSFFNLGDKVDKAKVSLGQWLTQLENQADALRNFRLNSIKAAKEGLDEGLIASLQDAGVSGALRMKQLANATDEEIERANKAWRRGQREIQRYIDATTEVPDELTTTVNVDTARARTKIEALEEKLRRISDEDVFINIRQIGSTTLGPRNEAANGATVPKTGRGYRDRHPYLLADGEEVISNRHGQADRHRPLLKAINAGRLADGGTAMGDLFRLSPRSAPVSVSRTVLVGSAASAGQALGSSRSDELLEQIVDKLDESHDVIGRGIARESGRGWSEKAKRTRASGHGGYQR